MERKGPVHVLGDSVDTDQIFPGKYIHIDDWERFGDYALEGYSDEYPEKINRGDIIVAGENFGLGSSRENAPVALKYAGIEAIISESFARIFYRNAINVGLPVIEIPNITSSVQDGDVVVVNLGNDTVKNNRTSEVFEIPPIPNKLMQILEAGGVRKQRKDELSVKDK